MVSGEGFTVSQLRVGQALMITDPVSLYRLSISTQGQSVQTEMTVDTL